MAHARRTSAVKHCRQAAAAQAIDGHACHASRKPGEQGRVPRDVAAVLTGLVGAAGYHILDCCCRNGALRHERADHAGQQIIWPDRCERAAMAAERGPQSLENISIEHG